MAKLYIAIGIVLLIAFFATGYYWYTNQPLTLSPTPTSKQITATSTPDGGIKSAPTTAVLALGERKQIGTIFITPLEIVEESRCPIDAICIQAGTIRIKARIESGSGTGVTEFKIGVPITTEAETITLVEAQPSPKASDPAPHSAYRFTFTVESRQD